jgi:adiponectin receptor
MQAQETPLALRSRNTSALKRVASGESGGGDGDNERLLLGHDISVNSEDRENLGCGVDEEQAYVERNPNGNKARQLWQKVKKKYELLEYHLVPEYLQDNEFVLRHYRSDWPIWDSLLSIFSLHNETVNIWTHLIGFLIFLVLTIDTMWDVPRLEQLFENLSRVQHMKQEAGDAVSILTEPVTRWPFFVFMGGSMFCLLSSTFCHLLNCHSSSLTYWLLRLDYAGIGIMIATSFFPPIYYVFLCQPAWRHFYLTSISVIGIGTVIISLIPVFQTAKYRAVRGLAFAGMGLSGIIPGAHALINFYQEPYCLQTLVYELGMAFFYLVGVAIYVTRIPERWRPGLFDIAGQSHQIFHVLVVAGAFTHYKGGLIFLEWRDKSGCL